MKKVDPIELELFKNVFVAISEEMAAVLGRTALSPNIKEREDFSCAPLQPGRRDPAPRARTSPFTSGPCPFRCRRRSRP